MMRNPPIMRKIIMTLLLVMSFFVSYHVEAQVVVKNNDERLAYQFFNNKEYEKAADLYRQLYDNTKKSQYFNQLIDCLILTNNFDEAESRLKSYLKTNSSAWKSHVDLAFVYMKNGEIDKSNKYISKIIKEVPETKNSILEVTNLLRKRNFNEAIIILLDKGAKSEKIDYNFYYERAYAYNTVLDFENCVKFYLLYLEENPAQYDFVKNRLRVLMMYNVADNVNDVIRMELLAKTQESPDNEEFSQLLMWFSLQQKDYEIALMQLKALDKRKDNYDGDIIYISQIARDNQQFDIAIDGYEYVAAKNNEGVFYIDAEVGLLETQYLKSVAESCYDKVFYENLSKRIEKAFKEIGFYKDTKSLMKIQAHILAFELGRSDEAIELINNALQLGFNQSDNAVLKMELADIYLFRDEVWEATLLYSQVEKSMKNEPIAHEARFRNGQLRYFIGEFEWAKASLDILKAATSKLIANDAMTLSLVISDNLEYDTVALKRLAKADYYIYQHRYDIANQMLDSINAYNPNEITMPSLLYRKAEIAKINGDFYQSDSLYKRIYEAYADSYIADEALMKDAQLLEYQLDKKEEAMECYAKLFDNYTASVFVAQARKNYRRIRDEIK